jgi:hypothetical protein
VPHNAMDALFSDPQLFFISPYNNYGIILGKKDQDIISFLSEKENLIIK